MSFALSCKCKYALSALVELAMAYASGEPLQSREIARRQNIPDRYLEQVLATLKRGGLVRSQRGVNGGYLLSPVRLVYWMWSNALTVRSAIAAFLPQNPALTILLNPSSCVKFG